jgi:hypothetical protein
MCLAKPKQIPQDQEFVKLLDGRQVKNPNYVPSGYDAPGVPNKLPLLPPPAPSASASILMPADTRSVRRGPGALKIPLLPPPTQQ